MTSRGDVPFYRGGRQASTVTVDTALDLLSDPSRRTILEYLASAPRDTVDSEAIVDYVARERPGRREAVAIQCIHRHLPKLREAGLIAFDRGAGEVRYRRDVRVEYLLDAIRELDR